MLDPNAVTADDDLVIKLRDVLGTIAGSRFATSAGLEAMARAVLRRLQERYPDDRSAHVSVIEKMQRLAEGERNKVN